MSQVRDFPISIAGLFRCCLASVDERADDAAKEGDIIPCKYCKAENGGVVLRDGKWRNRL